VDHGLGDPRRLQTPCTVRLGEPNRTPRCLTPSVARRCYRESSSSRVRPKRLPSFDGGAWFPPRQSQTPCYLVRATGTF
jgi:hypothetical protein